ncbi:MAG: SIR2 family protein [Candidatus Melainabacteria bacterium]|nr:MAG: SIR2 family protein [Candidatus Melainabacteria bacterium]
MPNSPGTPPNLQAALNVYHNKGQYALLLGSGVSRAANIPTGWDITLKQIESLALRSKTFGNLKELSEKEREKRLVSWFKKQYEIDPGYSAVMNIVGTTAIARSNIIKSALEPKGVHPAPTHAHKAIAKLAELGYFKVIITTNFDRLMENALTEVGIAPEVVYSGASLKGSAPLAFGGVQILKLHGDYKDSRIKNVDKELEKYEPKLSVHLNKILDDYGLIVCGWSAEYDFALRDILEGNRSKRLPLHFCYLNSIGSNAEKIVQKKSGIKIQIKSADAFFKQLGKDIAALENVYMEPPIVASVARAKTKVYITENARIDLTDLIMSAAEKYRREYPMLIFSEITPAKGKNILGEIEIAEVDKHKLYEVCDRVIEKGNIFFSILSALALHGKPSDFDLLLEEAILKLTESDVETDTDPPVRNLQGTARLLLLPGLYALYVAGVILFHRNEFTLLKRLLLQSEIKRNDKFMMRCNLPWIFSFDENSSLLPSILIEKKIVKMLADFHIGKVKAQQLFRRFEAFLAINHLASYELHKQPFRVSSYLDCRHYWHGTYMQDNYAIEELALQAARSAMDIHLFKHGFLNRDIPEAQTENIVSTFNDHKKHCDSLQLE